MSRTFQCQKCGKKIEADPRACCAPEVLGKEQAIYCCGSPMMEVIDD
ncbi:MAG: hypothetical protein ACE5HY_04865 [Candidatus Hydrothermarchaeales archaeon]